MRLVPLLMCLLPALPAVADSPQGSAATGEVPVSITFSRTLALDGGGHSFATDTAAWLRRELLAEAARSACADLIATIAGSCALDRIDYTGAEDSLPHGIRQIVGSATAHARIRIGDDQIR